MSELPNAELTTVHNYTLKEEMDLKKDKWLQFPMSSGIAVYAYDYTKKAQKKFKKQRKVKKK